MYQDEIEAYKKALRMAKIELNDLAVQRAEIDRRAARLRQTINSLAQLCDIDLEAEKEEASQFNLIELTLTDQVLNILEAADKPLPPVDIKKHLIKVFDVNPNSYTNFMATLHSILKRLMARGAIRVDIINKKKVYRIATSST
jgi:hypothetical protein